MSFDLLHSPDALVQDVDATVAAMVTRIGLLQPNPSWLQESSSHGYRAMFARVHRSRAAAPSRLEIISSFPQTRTGPADISANLGGVWRAQQHRPLKTHATVIATSDLPALHSHMLQRGVRCRLDPPSADLSHQRLWVGYADGEGDVYRADDDAGLMLEFIPTQCLGLPEPPEPGDIPLEVIERSPEFVRVAARSILVDDLDRTLETMADRWDWHASSVHGRVGRRCARMTFSLCRSASLELVERDYDAASRSFYERYGAGTFATRLTVGALAEKQKQLRGMGTPYNYLRGYDRPDVLRVDLGVVPGFLFDFVADEDELEDGSTG